MENMVNIKEEKSFNICKNSESSLITSKLISEQTEVDNPKSSKKFVTDDELSENLLETMKYEKNRLSSFEGKWPLEFIKVNDLTKAGFFYLQLNDRVQCAYCRLVLCNWKNGDIPLEIHIKESPTCPFLVTSRDVCGAYDNLREPSSNYNKLSLQQAGLKVYTAKKPHMSDIKRRLATFETWPLTMISAEELADCGFYYTGVADIVTCFFCGTSLTSWEPFDDPVTEHNKFYPDCAYLNLLSNRPIQKKTSMAKPFIPSVKNAAIKQVSLPEYLKSDIIKRANEIFPSWLVHDVVLQYIKKTGKVVTSFQQLCEKILQHEENRLRMNGEIKDKQSSELPFYPEALEAKSNNEATCSKNSFLCRICMDRERDIVFQPCRHLVACEKCANLISECPVCRKPIETTIKTYVS